MTKLNCTVKNCVHNKEKLCNLGNIKVEGTTAEISDSTACASFREKNSDSYSNAKADDKKPNLNAVVECMAQKCVYNEDCNCSATHIDVAGETAHNYTETRCATFTS